MCLAIPGKILDSEEIAGIRIGRIQFGGITRKAYLDYVPDAVPGDYVMVHVGFAISKVDEDEAARTYDLMRQMGLLDDELGDGADAPTIPTGVSTFDMTARGCQVAQASACGVERSSTTGVPGCVERNSTIVPTPQEATP